MAMISIRDVWASKGYCAEPPGYLALLRPAEAKSVVRREALAGLKRGEAQSTLAPSKSGRRPQSLSVDGGVGDRREVHVRLGFFFQCLI